MAGPPAGFEDFLTQKYNIQRQDATNRGNLENAQAGAITGALGTENALRTAQANETNTRASTLQPLAQSSIASTQAGIGETQARTGLYGTEARVQLHNAYDPLPDLINGHIYDTLSGLNRTQPGQTSQTGGGGSSYEGRSILDVGNLPTGAISPNNKIQLNSAGTERVPGKGSGKVDTVPAMLAPGEAVLNKGAAEHMGRDNIKQLNQVGLAKMGPGVGGKGMPAPKGVQKHAQGTQDVRARSAGASDFSPRSKEDFGDAPAFTGRAGTKIDPYSATMLYGTPWGGSFYASPYLQGSGINDPRPVDPRVGAGTLMDAIQHGAHYAQGTDMVPAAKVAPAPGQTITSGTWGETPPPPPQPTPGGFGRRLVRPPGPVPGFAKGTSKVPSAFYTKKDAAPLKPQALAKGTHNVMPGKSPTTPKAGPKGLANVLAAMQNAQPQTGGGMPGAMPMATAPGPRTT